MTAKIQFPQEAPPIDQKIEIHLPQAMGVATDIFLQEEARKIPAYNQEIIYNDFGKDKDGNKIAINTVGRWLFGVPGSVKHLDIENQGDIVFLHFASQAPSIVSELLNELKNNIENKLN